MKWYGTEISYLITSKTYKGMKEKSIFRNKAEMKKAFFEDMEDLNISTKGKKTKFDISLNIAFQEWKDFLKESGQISKRLYNCKLY